MRIKMNCLPKGLAHIGVPCRDIDESLAFYAQLGFEPINIKRGINNNNVAFVENNGCRIELVESLNPDKNGVGVRVDGCVDHFALVCDDIEKAYAECVEAGYTFASNGICSAKAWEPRACKFFMIKGPNNEKIEFAQIFD